MALFVAWVAGGLLGARERSWRAVFITALFGWLAALAVTQLVFRDGRDDPSYTPVFFLMMLLFIMLIIVVYEVWAKPGKQ